MAKEKVKKPIYKRWWFILLLIVAAVCALSSFKSGENGKKEGEEIEWSRLELGHKLPTPEGNMGEVSLDADNTLMVYLYKTSKDEYKDYADECVEYGFDVDKYKTSSYFMAYDEEGYQISVSYDETEEQMTIMLYAPVEKTEVEQEPEQPSESKEEVAEQEEPSKVEESSEVAEQPKDDGLVDGMRPEFKKAMDSYEEFYKHYCNVLTKFAENPTDLTILAEYTKLMGEAADMTAAFEAWDENEMNTEEALYYIEVNGRVSQMLIEAGGSYY